MPSDRPEASRPRASQPGTPTAVASTGTVVWAWVGIERHSVRTVTAAVKAQNGEHSVHPLPAARGAFMVPGSMAVTGTSSKSVSSAIIGIAIFVLRPSS